MAGSVDSLDRAALSKYEQLRCRSHLARWLYVNISLCRVARTQYVPFADIAAFVWKNTERCYVTASVTTATVLGSRSVPSASMSMSEATKKRIEARDPGTWAVQ